MVPHVPPQIDEHPVACARTMRSPYSWVASFMYAVSEQPSHAPENSSSGCWNCDPISVLRSNRAPWFFTVVANSQFFASTSWCASAGFMAIAP